MGEHHESRFKTVTFNFPAEDASMLSAIAKRFGRSNASFGGEVFSDGVRMLFLALSSEDRRKLAAEADADTRAYLESKGWNVVGDAAEHEYGRWSRYAAICDEVDAKEGK